MEYNTLAGVAAHVATKMPYAGAPQLGYVNVKADGTAWATDRYTLARASHNFALTEDIYLTPKDAQNVLFIKQDGRTSTTLTYRDGTQRVFEASRASLSTESHYAFEGGKYPDVAGILARWEPGAVGDVCLNPKFLARFAPKVFQIHARDAAHCNVRLWFPTDSLKPVKVTMTNIPETEFVGLIVPLKPENR